MRGQDNGGFYNIYPLICGNYNRAAFIAFKFCIISRDLTTFSHLVSSFRASSKSSDTTGNELNRLEPPPCEEKKRKKDDRPCYRYPPSLQELKDWWDQICVTWFLGGRGAARDKICQFRKSQSTLFSNNRKWRTFYHKADKSKIWVQVIIVTFRP